jgi:hypothetical protein
MDLAGLVEDVEHVILGFDERGWPRWTEVSAAAQRTEREVSFVGDELRGAVESHLGAALEGYVTRHGGTLGEARRGSVFVGGSLTGVQMACAVGVRCIGFVDVDVDADADAHDPGLGLGLGDERIRFEEAGASAVIASTRELAEALNARWDAQWCSRQYCC